MAKVLNDPRVFILVSFFILIISKIRSLCDDECDKTDWNLL